MSAHVFVTECVFMIACVSVLIEYLIFMFYVSVAGHLLTFYSVQEEELFSMRVPPHCHSWSELVASVHGKVR